MERLEEKLNIQHKAVLVLTPRGSGEELPALDDQSEDVVQGLEAFPDGILSLSVGDHLSTVSDTGEQTLEQK